MRKILSVTVLAAALCLGGVPAFAGDGEILGTGLGAALGGLVGSQFGHGGGNLAYTGLGVVTGGLIGNSIGSSMDRTNSGYYGRGYGNVPYYYYSDNTAYYTPNYVAPPAPQPPRVVYVQPEVYVQSPQPVVEYRDAPVYIDEDYVGGDSSTRYCREFTRQVRIDGAVHEAYGTACLRPDGRWQIQP